MRRRLGHWQGGASAEAATADQLAYCRPPRRSGGCEARVTVLQMCNTLTSNCQFDVQPQGSSPTSVTVDDSATY
jgi:hypothetical protein